MNSRKAVVADMAATTNHSAGIADPGLLENADKALAAHGRAVLDSFDVEAYRSELDSQLPGAHYQTFSANALVMQKYMQERFGGEGFAIVHCAVMIEAISGFEKRMPAGGYPESILGCFRRSYARILEKIRSLDFSGYDQPRDLMFKDLGICRQTLMPGGARVIEPVSAFPRSLIFRGGIRQFFAAAWFILCKTHGNSPFFNLHTHDFELGEFNEEGWRRLFLRIADLLKSRPHMKGVYVGSGWLYDPGLPEVSPRLGYHLGLTLPNGAKTFFYAYDNENSYAFAKSPTRRKLFEEGKYRPALHVLIWPRKELLAWAAKFPNGSAEL